MTTHVYRVFGLTLSSEIELPELRSSLEETRPDVTVSWGHVPPAVATKDPYGLSVTEYGATVSVKSVARFQVSGGTQIRIDPDPSADEATIRLFLMGTAMGAIFCQRRMFPLHANAIVIEGQAVAFAGPSRAGKSTLAAAFLDRGHAILSDDICVISSGIDGAFVAQPGIPRVRLWSDAIERSGRDASTLRRVRSGMDKFVVPTRASQPEHALPLRGIFVIGSDGPDVCACSLHGFSAVEALAANTYRASFLPVIGDPSLHFQTCLKLAQHVPIFELQRPWDSRRIDETADRIVTQLAALG
ncbi:hypothetical protein K9B35_00590 [Sphingomonas sp. R647]|uniref:hypothetical protein n=1 Tax=Sphingomonas sp. R647 TaxID=2875233 RepID=UPI001CD355E5|nr:hypothetical protein [Sphingomonas sp. R647]MCA1196453.1 hypothetical protein [Sphingomonas sp. R647]